MCNFSHGDRTAEKGMNMVTIHGTLTHAFHIKVISNFTSVSDDISNVLIICKYYRIGIGISSITGISIGINSVIIISISTDLK